jgi:hypothetical protein
MTVRGLPWTAVPHPSLDGPSHGGRSGRFRAAKEGQIRRARRESGAVPATPARMSPRSSRSRPTRAAGDSMCRPGARAARTGPRRRPRLLPLPASAPLKAAASAPAARISSASEQSFGSTRIPLCDGICRIYIRARPPATPRSPSALRLGMVRTTVTPNAVRLFP